MDPFFLSTALKYYKRREVQQAIVRHASHREVSPRYGQGFGKRPDVLENPADILAFVTRKATSFHCSEERWENPMQIVTGMNRKDANELRIGWDLVLDIDAVDWEISRLTGWLFVEALKHHDIQSISVKFSGNKGWHVGVPFEAFPESMVDSQGQDVPTSDLFPDLPKAIANYLVDYIGDTTNGLIQIDDDVVVFGGKIRGSLTDLAKKAGKTKNDLIITYCPACKKPVNKAGEQHMLMCGKCGHQRVRRYSPGDKAGVMDADLVCPKCQSIMDWHLVSRRDCPHNPASYQQRFKITEVIEFDTILLASRHLYRMPYSLHEKSRLSSVVIHPDDILSFKKEDANPETISLKKTFLELAPGRKGEAGALVAKAWTAAEQAVSTSGPRQQFEVAEDAITEEHFPPCMVNILKGMQDGRKRAMFALVNFLQVSGWPREMIEDKLHEWNTKNFEPLREVTIKGHVKHHTIKKEKILPPNCMSFYRDLGVCAPDDMCRRIKNPAQYAVRKSRLGKKGKKKK